MQHDDWRLQAACRGLDVEPFYSDDELDIRRAIATCARCPVRETCLQAAMAQREQFGVWGGTTGAARRRIFRRERRQRTTAA